MTATRYLLDTNICIYIARRKPPLLARFDRLHPEEAAISVFTFGELQYGAAKSVRREEVLRGLEELVSLLPVLPVPPSAGVEYGALRAALESRPWARRRELDEVTVTDLTPPTVAASSPTLRAGAR